VSASDFSLPLDLAPGHPHKARFLRTSAPNTVDGIEKYLASGMIRGIGAG